MCAPSCSTEAPIRQFTLPTPSESLRQLSRERRATCRKRGSEGARRGFTRTVVDGVEGVPDLERWLLDGAGRAWSGGNPGGCYRDPQNPDATAEMIRLFLETS